ncbi:hypothetical protein [Promicromonospora soli]
MAISAAAVLAPAAVAAADDGYGPGEPPCTMTFESQTVTVSEPFDFTVACEDLAGTTITVQIGLTGRPDGAAGADDRAVEVAGANSAEYTLDEDGTVSDTITVSASGDYAIQVLDGDGEPLSEVFTITAVAAGADGDGGLVVTGSTSLPYLVIAGGLLVLGSAAIVATRVRVRRS